MRAEGITGTDGVLRARVLMQISILILLILELKMLDVKYNDLMTDEKSILTSLYKKPSKQARSHLKNDS